DPPIVPGQADEPTSDGEKKQKYTRIQVRVDTKVRDVEHGTAKPTGQFNYTFTVERDIKVLPKSYTEFMMYIDARRRAMRIRESVEHDAIDSGAQERVTE
ncbi:hypothetical protein KCU90_g20169, partial [Aureobasidium melanogenum]